MPPSLTTLGLALAADATSAGGDPIRRIVGGGGLFVGVLVLLAVPLLVLLRSAARRRRRLRAVEPGTPPVDAWAESARRLRGDA
jgi:hypothetical protein